MIRRVYGIDVLVCTNDHNNYGRLHVMSLLSYKYVAYFTILCYILSEYGLFLLCSNYTTRDNKETKKLKKSILQNYPK